MINGNLSGGVHIASNYGAALSYPQGERRAFLGEQPWRSHRVHASHGATNEEAYTDVYSRRGCFYSCRLEANARSETHLMENRDEIIERSSISRMFRSGKRLRRLIRTRVLKESLYLQRENYMRRSPELKADASGKQLKGVQRALRRTEPATNLCVSDTLDLPVSLQAKTTGDDRISLCLDAAQAAKI